MAFRAQILPPQEAPESSFILSFRYFLLSLVKVLFTDDWIGTSPEAGDTSVMATAASRISSF